MSLRGNLEVRVQYLGQKCYNLCTIVIFISLCHVRCRSLGSFSYLVFVAYWEGRHGEPTLETGRVGLTAHTTEEKESFGPCRYEPARVSLFMQGDRPVLDPVPAGKYIKPAELHPGLYARQAGCNFYSLGHSTLLLD